MRVDAARLVLTVGLLVCCARSTEVRAQAAAPTLQVELAQTDFLQLEPVLVKISLTNPGAEPLRLVPPYCGRLRPDGKGAALSVQVVSEADGTVAWDVVGGTYAGPKWYNARVLDDARIWTVAPGTAVFTWFDWCGPFYRLAPGQYRIRFTYAPTAAMVFGPDGTQMGVWEGRLTAETDVITIRAPKGADAETAAKVRTTFGSAQISLVVPNDPGLRTWILETHPTSTYGAYARFYDLWYKASAGCGEEGGFPDGLEQAQGEADAFSTEYPGFPLNYQLPVIVGYAHCMRRTRVSLAEDEAQWDSLVRLTYGTHDLLLAQRMVWERSLSLAVTRSQARDDHAP